MKINFVDFILIGTCGELKVCDQKLCDQKLCDQKVCVHSSVVRCSAEGL